MFDAIVVGKGILGATTARALRAQGRTVLVIDREEPLAGTNASAGHLRPSTKFTGLSNDDYETCLTTLDDIYGLTEETFKVRVKVIGTVKEEISIARVDPSRLEGMKYLTGNVKKIVSWSKTPRILVQTNSGIKEFSCRLLVLALGCWTLELLGDHFDASEFYFRRGVSPRFKDNGVEAMIEPWAPYKYMMVGRLDSGELWTSDGTAIKPENWTSERRDTCEARLRNWIGSQSKAHRIDSGIRPFHKLSKPCLLKPINPKETIWVLTGGGKFGTLAAAWAAKKLQQVQL